MKYLFAIILIFWITTNFVFGQKSEYKIRVKNQDLVLTHQGKSHKYKLVEQIDAEKVTDTEILFASRKENFTYLVLDISGQSREEENDRQCGAGIESNLIWLKLDSKWQIADINSQRYESCWSSIDSGDGYKINGNILTIEFDNFRKDVNVKLSYNADEPEKGFRIEQKAIEKK